MLRQRLALSFMRMGPSPRRAGGNGDAGVGGVAHPRYGAPPGRRVRLRDAWGRRQCPEGSGTRCETGGDRAREHSQGRGDGGHAVRWKSHGCTVWAGLLVVGWRARWLGRRRDILGSAGCGRLSKYLHNLPYRTYFFMGSQPHYDPLLNLFSMCCMLCTPDSRSINPMLSFVRISD